MNAPLRTSSDDTITAAFMRSFMHWRQCDDPVGEFKPIAADVTQATWQYEGARSGIAECPVRMVEQAAILAMIVTTKQTPCSPTTAMT